MVGQTPNWISQKTLYTHLCTRDLQQEWWAKEKPGRKTELSSLLCDAVRSTMSVKNENGKAKTPRTNQSYELEDAEMHHRSGECEVKVEQLIFEGRYLFQQTGKYSWALKLISIFKHQDRQPGQVIWGNVYIFNHFHQQATGPLSNIWGIYPCGGVSPLFPVSSEFLTWQPIFIFSF